MAIFACGASYSQIAKLGTEKGPGPEQPAQGGIATLYALDPLARAFCFHDGREGLMFRNDRVTRRCSDISFSRVGGDLLTAGAEANTAGAIIDLGTADELRARYAQDNTAGVGFASLRIHAGKIVVQVLKEDRPQEKVEPLKEAEALSNVGPSPGASILLGHIYVVRIADIKDSGSQLFVKLMVIAYTPNESVTLRWQLL
jgi:hypothetical protein